MTKILIGLAVLITGLLYIKHTTIPTADVPYLAVMLVFLALMMTGGGLITAGAQAIVTAARS